MKAQRNLAAVGSTRRKLAYAAVATLFCVVLPPTTVSAGGFPVDATGVVTCKVSYLDGTSANIQYPVEVSMDGTVVGRWGPGNDVVYTLQIAEVPDAGARNVTHYLYSMTDPLDPTTYERLYSETGKLDFKVGRDGAMSIAGKSFVVMEYFFVDPPPVLADWVALNAECTWKLSGTLPGG